MTTANNNNTCPAYLRGLFFVALNEMILPKTLKSTLILLFVCVCSIANVVENTQYRWSDLERENVTWDSDIGLWASPGPGHTAGVKDAKTVRSARAASGTLLHAGILNLLNDIRVEKVLQNIRDLQDKETGCLRWYYEEDKIYDTNAAFFIGKDLILLRSCYYKKLSPKAKTILNDILKDLYRWLYYQTGKGDMYYPNKYLGDLVCSKLLQEIFPVDSTQKQRLNTKMQLAADYWNNQHFGWGEHMSDVYAAVCLDIISQYLLFSQDKNSNVYATYKDLFDKLLNIEDSYDKGPRVPQIRCYSFTQTPETVNYRDLIRPLKSSDKKPYTQIPRMIFYQHDWHSTIAAPPQKIKSDITVECYKSLAKAHILDDIRIGSMSHFPIMPTAENRDWGLSWQSMPVALWRPQGDWAFFQWQTMENGLVRAHPMNENKNVKSPRSLTDSVNPPIYGKTFCLQNKGDLIILRIMPAIAQSWQNVSDAFKLINNNASVIEMTPNDHWHQLLLKYPQRTVSVNYISITKNSSVSFQSQQDTEFWQVDYSKDNLRNITMIIDLWAISINGQIHETPVFQQIDVNDIPLKPYQKPVILQWNWPNTKWNILIDPLTDDPLKSHTGTAGNPKLPSPRNEMEP